MRLGKDTASMTNFLLSGTNGAPAPNVGMGATILMWTDRHAATIVSVSPSQITVGIQRDKAIRVDSNGMSECQVYDFVPDPSAPIEYYSMRKSGAYVKVDDSQNGTRLRIGERSEYHDFSF